MLCFFRPVAAILAAKIPEPLDRYARRVNVENSLKDGRGFGDALCAEVVAASAVFVWVEDAQMDWLANRSR